MKVILNLIQLLLISVQLVSIVNCQNINKKNHAVQSGLDLKLGQSTWNEEPDLTDEFVADILKFIELGEEQIELSEIDNDAIIFVGLTGVGKSTVTVFVGGEENRLTIICSDETGNCYINDDLELISPPTIVSKTFLPNLIEDQSLQRALYDMPGFNDNRNNSVEIANAFFIKKVTDHASTVKIVIVATDSQLSANAKADFISLLKAIVRLCPTIGKFAGGVALVGNIAPQDKTSTQILNSYKIFLQDCIDNFEELGFDNPAEKASVLELLQTVALDDGKYIGFMQKPTQDMAGPIELVPKYQENKATLRKLIFETLEYQPKVATDFQVSISDTAKLVLKRAKTIIVMSLLEDIQEYSNLTQIKYCNILLNIQKGQTDLIETHQHNFEAIRDLKFIACMSWTSSPSSCTNEIILEMLKIDTMSAELEIKLRKSGSNLDFVILALGDGSVEQPINFLEWIKPLRDLKAEIEKYVKDQMRETHLTLSKTVQDFSNVTESKYRSMLLNIRNGETELIDTHQQNFEAIRDLQFDACLRPDSSPSACTNETVLEMLNIDGFSEDLEMKVRKSGTILDFFIFAINIENNEQFIDYLEWIKPLQDLKAELAKYVEEQTFDTHLSLSKTIQNFSYVTQTKYMNILLNIQGGQTNLIETHQRKFEAIRDLKFDTCLSLESSPSSCTNAIILELLKIDIIPEELETNLTKSGRILDFFILAISLENGNQFINFLDWIIPLQDFKSELARFVDEQMIETIVLFSRTVCTTTSQSVVVHLKAEADDFKDIIEKMEYVDKKLKDWIALKTLIERKFNDYSVDLGEFLTFLSEEIASFANVPESNIENMTSAASVATFLSMWGQFQWKDDDWFSVWENINNYLVPEQAWSKFTPSLFLDLEDEKYQSSKIGDLHNWWRTFFPVTLRNFDSMWTKFQSTDISTIKLNNKDDISKLLSNNSERLELLNSLLSTVLITTQCTSASRVLRCNGNYISMKDVTISPNIDTVLIYSMKKVFIDTGFTATQLNSNGSVKMFIMAPKWRVTHNLNFNLNGIDGPQPYPISPPGYGDSVGARGANGANAGNIVLVGEQLINETNAITFQLNGGTGGTGQNGQTGAKGEKGESKSHFNARNEDHCAAWSGGWIRVKLYPNGCNSGGDSTCRAGENGNIIDICGFDGYINTGGAGGVGGDGGTRGQAVIFDVDVTANTIKNGTNGNIGNQGHPGQPGTQGNPGDTLSVHLDDRGAPRHCEEIGRDIVPETQFCRNQRKTAVIHQQNSKLFAGSEDAHKAHQIRLTKELPILGRNSTLPTNKTVKNVNLVDFKLFFLEFIHQSKIYTYNQFIGNSLTDFVRKVESHPKYP